MSARKEITDAGPDAAAARERLSGIVAKLGSIDPEKRMSYPYVD